MVRLHHTAVRPETRDDRIERARRPNQWALTRPFGHVGAQWSTKAGGWGSPPLYLGLPGFVRLTESVCVRDMKFGPSYTMNAMRRNATLEDVGSQCVECETTIRRAVARADTLEGRNEVAHPTCQCGTIGGPTVDD